MVCFPHGMTPCSSRLSGAPLHRGRSIPTSFYHLPARRANGHHDATAHQLVDGAAVHLQCEYDLALVIGQHGDHFVRLMGVRAIGEVENIAEQDGGLHAWRHSAGKVFSGFDFQHPVRCRLFHRRVAITISRSIDLSRWHRPEVPDRRQRPGQSDPPSALLQICWKTVVSQNIR